MNQNAQFLVALSTGQIEEPAVTQSEISKVMAELGRRGGKIGGKARAAILTKKQRIAIATNAAQKRWSNRENAGNI